MTIKEIMQPKGIIEKQKAKLAVLERKSADALDIVTSTIRNLDEVNNEIDEAINNIEAYKAELENTQGQLNTTKSKNRRILNKFKGLIEEE